jgi:hypothetical protein
MAHGRRAAAEGVLDVGPLGDAVRLDGGAEPDVLVLGPPTPISRV